MCFFLSVRKEDAVAYTFFFNYYFTFLVVYPLYTCSAFCLKMTWSPLLPLDLPINHSQSFSKCYVTACQRLLPPYKVLKMVLLLPLAGK